jgi:AcrR family transcriptional regulator
MPKIVDHDAYSRQLAVQAASYFSAHGYAGTSMRKVAAHLGLSKSALYHYFPTKEALFLACTQMVMSGEEADLLDPALSEGQNLDRLYSAMAPTFASEMSLVFDYLRGKEPAAIAADEAMRLAVANYRALVAGIVGEERAEEELQRLLGRLLLTYLSGSGAGLEAETGPEIGPEKGEAV